jgi:ABC-type sugar transport system ATPase subunit
VLVTHDRDEAYELADRVALMVDGRIEQCAPPAELWARPASRRVAEFLGVFNCLEAGLTPQPRDGGCWIAPLAALQPAADCRAGEAWRFGARVLAAHPGRQQSSVELLAWETQSLTLLRPAGAALPAPGDWLELALPVDELQYLAG